MGFYKDKYDCIVIGGALAGLASAIQLASSGLSVLVLERHNLPGGIATSFVRNGREMEASLHEMMSIGEPHKPLKIRRFLEEFGIKVDWMRVPEAYRLVVEKENIDITLHAGFSGSIENDKFVKGDFKAAKEIEQKYPGTFKEVNRLLNLCASVYNSVNVLSIKKCSKIKMLLKHSDFVKTAGYSTQEVLDKFNLPSKVKDILKAYWIYVGSPFKDLPFTIYAVLMADYLIGGSYVCREFSHELSLRMAERAVELGVQIEYNQEVIKILTENNHTTGVITKRNDKINAPYVITSTYPNTAYAKMIDDVPLDAIKNTNSREIGLTCVSVILTLDAKPRDLNIKDYSVFSSETNMDLDAIWENGKTLGPYNYLTTICLNYANKDCVEDGLTSLSITYLPHPSAFINVKKEEYLSLKRKIAKDMIETVSKRLNVNLFEHIVDIEIEMPHSVAHYTADYMGSIYGYRHTMEDHIVARLQMSEDENYIKGLAFAGAHGISGDGMSPCITNGRKAAKTILSFMKEEKYLED